MTEQVKQKQTFTHVIQLPPNTDVQEMLGSYKHLFTIQQVDVTLLGQFPSNSQGFSHPIPECNKILTDDFLNTMTTIEASKLEHGTIYLENFTVNANSVVFIFFYLE